ncbi:hypothetical protein LTR56_027860, partial [Elasticomyces elasticus]
WSLFLTRTRFRTGKNCTRDHYMRRRRHGVSSIIRLYRSLRTSPSSTSRRTRYRWRKRYTCGYYEEMRGRGTRSTSGPFIPWKVSAPSTSIKSRCRKRRRCTVERLRVTKPCTPRRLVTSTALCPGCRQSFV